MIRRDYILRMIAEFIEVLNRIDALKKGELWVEAKREIEDQFKHLIGATGDELARLTDTEMLAKLVQGEPTQVIREKTAIISTLLKEAGDVALGSGDTQRANLFYLRGLHLLLDVLGQGDVWEFPEFLPKIESFTAALAGSELPLATHARLMQHYERAGEFAKAEDELFAIVDLDNQAAGLLQFGIAFYERLRSRPDRELADGDLPRNELEAGLKEFRQRVTTDAVKR